MKHLWGLVSLAIYLSVALFPVPVNGEIVPMGLGNGMRVWLKKVESEEKGIVFKLQAKGGFTAFPESSWGSAALSPLVARESGIGPWTPDQLEAFLYKKEIDFDAEVGPYSRQISGEVKEDELEIFLKLIQSFFTTQQFSQEAFNNVLTQVKNEGISYPLLENQQWDNLNLEQIKEQFTQLFGDPSQFQCVLVGAFNTKKVESLVRTYLGAIPSPKEPASLKPNYFPSIPLGVTQGEIKTTQGGETNGEIIFPLHYPSTQFTEKDEETLQGLTQLLKNRLHKGVGDQTDLLDVCYLFPMFPENRVKWIRIRFCKEENCRGIENKIVAEIAKLQKEGFSEEEVSNSSRILSLSDPLALQDRYFLSGLIASYALWEWPIENLEKKKVVQLDAKSVNSLLRQGISLDHYRVLFNE